MSNRRRQEPPGGEVVRFEVQRGSPTTSGKQYTFNAKWPGRTPSWLILGKNLLGQSDQITHNMDIQIAIFAGAPQIEAEAVDICEIEDMEINPTASIR